MSSHGTIDYPLLWICPYCQKRVPMRAEEFPLYCRCGNVGVAEEAVPFNSDKDPSLLEMGVNLLKAGQRAVKKKFKRVSKEEYNRRLEICSKPCEFVIMRDVVDRSGKLVDKIPSRCRHKKCGCFLKNKAWLESENCPMGYWDD